MQRFIGRLRNLLIPVGKKFKKGFECMKSDKNKLKMTIPDFEPRHIFECGQCFRWNREADGSYTGVAHGKVLNVLKDGDEIVFDNIEEGDFENIWSNYFDLNRKYSEIEKKLSELDETMENAVSFGHGMRILNQDPWETLISFIISANNGMARIKGIVEKLSENYGAELGEYGGKRRYSFPEAGRLASLSASDIRTCGAGYRDEYILRAARAVSKKSEWLDLVCQMDTTDAKKELVCLSGIGPKVSDCILLFSMKKMDTFPIDVWVRRTMEYFYLHKKSSPEEISAFAEDYFGELKGFAQQYLFHYARQNNIGK